MTQRGSQIKYLGSKVKPGGSGKILFDDLSFSQNALPQNHPALVAIWGMAPNEKLPQ